MPTRIAGDGTRAARYALGVLTFINLFNYLDRLVMAALVDPIKASLHISDAQLGLIVTGFIVVYMLTSPIFGSLGDRKRRPPLIALGVAIWSIATTLGGFSQGFLSLLIPRSAVGIGEAAYGTIAPALLSDYFPAQRRGRVFAVFFAAIPIGSAAAYIVGGYVGARLGWRAAFWIAGLPGLLLAALVYLVKDVPRGQNDDAPIHAGHATSLGAYLNLVRNRTYILSVLGYAAYTFALGGLAFWMPTFLSRVRGIPHERATVTFGVITVVTGFTGTFAGGWLGDLFLKRSKQSYLWVSGVSTLIAAPFAYAALASPQRSIYLPAIVIAEVLIFMSTGPINSAIVNAVAPAERATAVGLSIFVMHLLGDVPSPPLIGWISDRSSLAHGVMVVPLAIVIGGVIWIWGARAGRASARQKESPG